MKKTSMNRLLTFAVAIVMAATSVTIPSVQAEAASGGKTVKSVKLKIGKKNVTNKKYTMTVGQKKKIKVTVGPKTSKKSVTFKSSKKKVAKVSKKGVITAKSAGKAKITVTVTGKDKKKTKKYIRLVVKKATAVKSVKLKIGSATVTNKGYTMTAGQKAKVNVTVTPKAAKKSIAFKSNKTKVAAVNKSGTITAKSAGTAKITVTVTGKNKKKKTKYINLSVKDSGNNNNNDNNDNNDTPKEIPVSGVTATISPASIKVGETAQVRASVNPENATNKTLTYSSGNKAVASVDNTGKVVGVSAGKADITVKSANGKTASVSVTVVETPVTGNTDLSYDGYKLKWEDNFDGTSLSREDWNVETHDPGWVNNELQAYVDSEENIFLKDGSLVLKPVEKTGEDGTVSYTSGRINTQNKHNFKYGLFEARVKVPKGQGFLPAFWMMPANENLYGQWPRCGEIDIMEVLGHETNKSYGTIHYGNPHSESQGNYTLASGDFSEEYHIFNVEWVPGKINWYVDGTLIHTEDDWYSATEGQGEISYPAPFDQPFYIILNLAVGGSWPGNPDETTDIANSAFYVDYVRAYQKDSYDENVQKPIKDVVLRDPDANGNYVVNGDFAVQEDLTDDKDWSFLTTLGGEGAASIQNNEIVMNTTAAGTADYSIQLVQPNLPMKKGGVYQLTFDAYADSSRTMKVDVSAPDRSYRRYLNDTEVELTTGKQTYTYNFTMTDNDDANARLEFNLGATESTASVHISNVSLKKTDEIVIEEGKKTVLADGNYVYNGSFQEGEGRLGYWNVTKNPGSEVKVTNEDNIRRLMINAPEGTSPQNPIVVSQDELALTEGNAYALSLKAEGENGKSIRLKAAGKDFTFTLTGEEAEYTDKLVLDTKPSDTNIAFYIEQPGVFYIDDVRIEEDSLIKNGSFNAGFAGYEAFVDGSASADYVVDSLSEDNAADFSIKDTGDADWKIQLKQNNVRLEEGQWYRLSLKAKSSLERKLMFAIQRDGAKHNDDWTPYSNQKIVDLGKEYQIYTDEFQMTEASDNEAVLSISMGAVGGAQITTQHRICIDDISLEKIEAPETPPVQQQPGEDLLGDGNFTDGKGAWVENISSPGQATATFENGSAKFDITDVGTADWHVQLKRPGIALQKGKNYTVSFKATSTAARDIKVAILSEKFDWYGGADVSLEANQETPVTFSFTMDKETDLNASLVVSMGKIEEKETPASEITLKDFSLILNEEAPGGPTGPTDPEAPTEPTDPEDPTEPTINPSTAGSLIQKGEGNLLSNLEGNWEEPVTDPAAAKVQVTAEGKVQYAITNPGTEDWHVQLKRPGLKLSKGVIYCVSCKAVSTETRDIKLGVRDDKDADKAWYGGGENITLEAGKEQTIKIAAVSQEADANALMAVFMGKVGNSTPASTITLSDFSMSVIGPKEVGAELLNAQLSEKNESWDVKAVTAPADATVSFKDGKVEYDIKNVGNSEWDVQLKQSNLVIEQGCSYEVSFKVTSAAARTIKMGIYRSEKHIVLYGGNDNIQLNANEEQTVTVKFTMEQATDPDSELVIGMGKIGDSTGTGKITLSDFSVKKVTKTE